MATLDMHMEQYRAFKTSADSPGVTPQGRVEMLFLAAYHLIDACAAKKGQHISKHQNVRRELEKNPLILGERTDKVWRAFNDLQGDCRSRFVYGGRWTKEDWRIAVEAFGTIELLCLEAVG